MTTYVQTNENGEVVIPLRIVDDRFPEEIENKVEADFQTNRPTTSWDEKAIYSGGNMVDGVYVVDYSVEDRFTTDDEKLRAVEVLKKQYLQQVERKFKNTVDQLRKEYPEAETISWTQQVREAEAYTADEGATVTLLSSIADSRGITVAELASRVLTKSNQYLIAYGAALGEYQLKSDLLEAIDLEDSATWDNLDLVRG